MTNSFVDAFLSNIETASPTVQGFLVALAVGFAAVACSAVIIAFRDSARVR